LGTVFAPFGPSESQRVVGPWLPTQNLAQQAFVAQ
jgi:hypothetical protein